MRARVRRSGYEATIDGGVSLAMQKPLVTASLIETYTAAIKECKQNENSTFSKQN